MRTIILVALLALPLTPLLAQETGRKRVQGTDISLIPPRDFKVAQKFSGFEYPDAGASIMVSVLRGGIGNFIVGMTDERMKAKGMTVLSRQRIEVDGKQGLLLHLAQDAGGHPYRKWMLVFGDTSKTALLLATFPKEKEELLSRAMRDSLLTAKTGARGEAAAEETGDESATEAAAKKLEGVPFKITPTAPLKLAEVINKTVMLTRGGTYPIAEPGDPLFIAGAAVATVTPSDRKKYALTRLQATATAKEIEVKSVSEIKINGLPGFEIVANAKHDPSGTPLLLYQVMLFTADSTYLMQGMGLLNADPGFLGPFRKTAQSFKR